MKNLHKTSKLSISYVSPHKPVGKDTTARWTKEMLTLSGINPKIFQSHSKRSASTSKAFTKGLRALEINLKWEIGQINRHGKDFITETLVRQKSNSKKKIRL